MQLRRIAIEGDPLALIPEDGGRRGRKRCLITSRVKDVRGNTDGYTIQLDSGRATQLTNEPSIDGHGTWSIDGRWIYFSSTRTGRPEIWKVPARGGPAIRVTFQGGIEPKESPDGRSLFYLDRPPQGAGGLASVAVLKQVPIDRGEEIAILDNVRFGLWSVTRAGVVFLSTDGQVDQLSLYEIVNRQVRTLGKLQFRTSRIGGYGQLRVSRDGRWVLLTTTDHWESDIMVADGFR